MTNYTNRSEIEQIWKTPDVIIGGDFHTEVEMHHWDKNKIVKSTINICDIHYNVCDEIISNAVDHAIRTRQYSIFNDDDIVKNIYVDIDGEKITIKNDGKGIDIVMVDIHKKIEDETITIRKYKPESIFTDKGASSNYDVKDHYSCGKFGYGSFLTSATSSYFHVTTCCDGKKYEQGLTHDKRDFTVTTPAITQYDGNDYTEISFITHPDIIDNSTLGEIKSLLIRRCVEIPMMMADKRLSVHFNGVQIPRLTLTTFVDKYIKRDSSNGFTYQSSPFKGEKNKVLFYNWSFYTWVEKNSSMCTEISYVNGIYTPNGGTHLKYIKDKITDAVCRALPARIYSHKKPDKDNVIKKREIRLLLSLCVIAFVNAPQFDGQVKGKLITKSSSFEKVGAIPTSKIRKLINGGLLEKIQLVVDDRARTKFKNTTTRRVRSNIEKYIEATEVSKLSQRKKCCLIITEGDSASGHTEIGLSAMGCNGSKYYGIYTFGGVPINTHISANSFEKVSANKVYKSIVTILGLELGKDYSTDKAMSTLRYRRVVMFTDADDDGSHIRGLGLNMFYNDWPSLVKREDFLFTLRTYAVRIYKNKKKEIILHQFWSTQQFHEWMNENRDSLPPRSYIKYFKGIATLTKNEIQNVFRHFDNNLVSFTYDSNAALSIRTALFKTKSAKLLRKQWMRKYNPEYTVSYEGTSIPCSDFINGQFKQFCMYSLVRCIPCLMDGLKLCQRKIIWGASKIMSADNEYIVEKLVGKISSLSEYKHGATSMSDALCRMNQRFTNANNINLLRPEGNFGSRLNNKCGCARYISTKLPPWFRLIYRPEDESCLKYTNEEGNYLEPAQYYPIIPMILVNGCNGIATGFSTKVPKFNWLKIMKYILEFIESGTIAKNAPFIPYYTQYGNNSHIIKNKTNYKSRGTLSYNFNGVVIISELPVDVIMNTYQENSLKKTFVTSEKVQSYERHIDPHNTGDENKFEYKITLNKKYVKILSELESHEQIDKLYKDFQLIKNVNITNMMLFDSESNLKKYTSIRDIFMEFCTVRLKQYKIRKQKMLDILARKIQLLTFKYLFVKKCCDREIIMEHKSLDNVESQIIEQIPDVEKRNNSFNYLTGLPMHNLTTDYYNKLKKLRESKILELNTLTQTPIRDIWKSELKELHACLRSEKI